YHGVTQWAVASDPPPYVKAMAPLVTSTFFGDLFYPGGAFALESALTWTMGLKHQELPRAQVILVLLTGSRRVAKASVSLPLADAERVLGRDAAPYYREWLEHPDIDDSFWNRIDFGKDLSAVPPAMLVAGWYDVFGASQIEDFARLRASGREATLRVGPWTHASLGTHRFAIRETLAWMDRHLRDGHHVQPG